jgi:4-carboxymuconolactone decarboxylase
MSADRRPSRVPPLERSAMNDAQRAAADELIAGPRRGVTGPFIALLRSPELLTCVAKLGEHLRFKSVLDRRTSEFVTIVVSRRLTNQFEWATHQPLALKCGVAPATADAIAEGRRPDDMTEDESLAYDFTEELLHTQGVSDTTYARALARFSEVGIVELTTLIGYFVLVSWLLNVTRIGAPPDAAVEPLIGLPA